MEDNVKIIVREYCKTIKWILEYYMYGCKDWQYYYEYNFSPLLVDLNRYMIGTDLQHEFKDVNAIETDDLLNMIIPEEYLKKIIKLKYNNNKIRIIKNKNKCEI